MRKSSANNSVIFKPKIQVRGVFQSVNKWNQDVESNFGLGQFLNLLLLG